MPPVAPPPRRHTWIANLLLALALVLALSWLGYVVQVSADQYKVTPALEARSDAGWQVQGTWWQTLRIDEQSWTLDAGWGAGNEAQRKQLRPLAELLQQENTLYEAAAASRRVSLHGHAGTLELSFSRRGIGDLSLDFWLHMAASLAVVCLCSIVAWQQRGRGSALALWLCGATYFVALSCFAIYFNRPWALSTPEWIFYIRLFGFTLLVYIATVLHLVLQHPHALLRRRCQWTIPALIVGAAVAYTVSEHRAVVVGVRLITLLSCLGILAGLVIQLLRSRHSVIDRMVMRWVTLGVLVGWVLPVYLYLMWVAGATQSYPPALPGLCFAVFTLTLMAIVYREQLFRLEHLWSHIWAALACLLWITLANLVLRNGTGWPDSASFMFALAAAPGLYGFVHRWLKERYEHRAGRSFQQYLPMMMECSEGGFRLPELEHRWQTILRSAFSPTDLSYQPQASASDAAAIELPPPFAARITSSGEQLLVHSFQHAHCVLTGARNSLRSFSRHDVQFADELRDLALQLWQPQTHFLRGVRSERARLASDLHDDIGGKLLHLAQSTQGHPAHSHARHILDDLRQLTRGLAHSGRSWEELFADLRFDLDRRATAHGVTLDWSINLSATTADSIASVENSTDVIALLSELCRNALQHARPSCLHVHIDEPAPGLLRLGFEHNSSVPMAPPAQWVPGFGLHSIRRRVTKLQGESSWGPSTHCPGGICFTATLHHTHQFKP